MKYVPTRVASEKLGLHPNTVRKYAKNGLIEVYITQSGQMRFNIEEFLKKRVQKSTSKTNNETK